MWGHCNIGALRRIIINLASIEKKRNTRKGESTIHLRYMIRGAGKVWDSLVDWNPRVRAFFDAAHNDQFYGGIVYFWVLNFGVQIPKSYKSEF
jgi:hypothetical protein